MRYFCNAIIIYMVNKLKHCKCTITIHTTVHCTQICTMKQWYTSKYIWSTNWNTINVPSPYHCTLYTDMYHEVYLQSTIPSNTCCHTCADLHAEVIWVDHVSDLAQVVLCDLHFPLWTESFRLDVFTGSYNILHSPTPDPERKHQTITSELDLSFSSCLDQQINIF